MAKKTTQPEPIGVLLRRQRIEVLRLGLREMARILDTAPAHLTDIEKGRRSPSDQLLGRIAAAYQIKESALRFGWSKLDPNVGQISTQDATAAEVAPQLMQFAKTYAPAQWHELLEQAKRIARKGGGK